LNLRILYIAAVLLVYFTTARAKDSPYSKPDTVFLSRGSVLIIESEKYKAKKDTFIIIPPGTEYQLKIDRKKQSEDFFDSLEVRASQRKWTDRLHNIVVTAPKKGAIIDTLQTSQSISPFVQFDRKIIRNIKIQRLAPFGPTIFDTTRMAVSALEKVGNKAHLNTREKIISNYLLFSEGDRIDPSVLSDNERIIRRLSFIEDARIFITETSRDPDSVDVLVLTKDAFSIGMGLEILDWDAGNIKFFENNLAGIGHELHASFHWNGLKDPWYGEEFYYIINNIGGSFIDNKIRYAKIFDKETFEVNFDRPFFAPSTKYAGAIRYEHTSRISKINFGDTLVPTRINYHLFDLWAGRSFSLNSSRSYSDERLNFVFASRVQKMQFIKRPDSISDNTFYYFHNKTLWLSSLSITSQKFFRSNLIYSFGRTEDIPHGFLLNFTFGPEFGEFNRRFYMGTGLAWGGLIGNIGYIYTNGELGGFSSSLGSPDQAIMHVNSSYFTNLFIINRFKMRHFISLDYMKGVQRFADEYISISDDTGIRGYDNDLARGTKRAFANYEIVLFSPYHFYGFRFVFYGFADLGLISFSESLLQGQLHSGVGLGVRIKNERLTFETIQLRIGYYPSLPDETFPFALYFSGEQRLNPHDFYVSKPEVIGFE